LRRTAAVKPDFRVLRRSVPARTPRLTFLFVLFILLVFSFKAVSESDIQIIKCFHYSANQSTSNSEKALNENTNNLKTTNNKGKRPYKPKKSK
jgi:hypothetical protein